jgi:hypothetical protein
MSPGVARAAQPLNAKSRGAESSIRCDHRQQRHNDEAPKNGSRVRPVYAAGNVVAGDTGQTENCHGSEPDSAGRRQMQAGAKPLPVATDESSQNASRVRQSRKGGLTG